MRKMMGSNTTEQTILQSGDNAKYVEVHNNELSRDVVNIKNFMDFDLKGTIKINTKGVPFINADNRYMELRKIFKLVAKVLRNLREYDLGKLISMFLKNKLKIFEEEEMDFMNAEVFLPYDIITYNLLEDDSLALNDVKKALNAIADQYETKYSVILQETNITEPIFNNEEENEMMKPLI